jgi:hypothetical protein
MPHLKFASSTGVFDVWEASPVEVQFSHCGTGWTVYHCDHYNKKHTDPITNPDEHVGPWYYVVKGWTGGLPYSYGYSSRDEAIEAAAVFAYDSEEVGLDATGNTIQNEQRRAPARQLMPNKSK